MPKTQWASPNLVQKHATARPKNGRLRSALMAAIILAFFIAVDSH